MNEAKEVRLVFNPGKHGTVGLHAVITMSGDRAGALPQPTRRGYTFLGWYTVPDGAAGGEHINSSTVIGRIPRIRLYCTLTGKRAKRQRNPRS